MADVVPGEESGREVEFVDALGARKVRLTETDLKLRGFLIVEEFRTLFLSTRCFGRSALDASVSEPLTLASAEFTNSLTTSAICLCSALVVLFTVALE